MKCFNRMTCQVTVNEGLLILRAAKRYERFCCAKHKAFCSPTPLQRSALAQKENQEGDISHQHISLHGKWHLLNFCLVRQFEKLGGRGRLWIKTCFIVGVLLHCMCPSAHRFPIVKIRANKWQGKKKTTGHLSDVSLPKSTSGWWQHIAEAGVASGWITPVGKAWHRFPHLGLFKPDWCQVGIKQLFPWCCFSHSLEHLPCTSQSSLAFFPCNLPFETLGKDQMGE